MLVIAKLQKMLFLQGEKSRSKAEMNFMKYVGCELCTYILGKVPHKPLIVG